MLSRSRWIVALSLSLSLLASMPCLAAGALVRIPSTEVMMWKLGPQAPAPFRAIFEEIGIPRNELGNSKFVAESLARLQESKPEAYAKVVGLIAEHVQTPGVLAVK